MAFLRRACSSASSSLLTIEPALVAAHVSFTRFAYEDVLQELSEAFRVSKDTLEVFEVSPFERIFALWVSPSGGDDDLEHARIKALVQRIESIPGVRQCILQQESLFFVNTAGMSFPSSCSCSVFAAMAYRM